jgi:uncharacterized protein
MRRDISARQRDRATSSGKMKCSGLSALGAFLVILMPLLHAQPASIDEVPDPEAVGPPKTTLRLSIEPSRRMRGKNYPWEHEIKIALPASYRSSHKTYPVLWVTDGQFNFDPAVEIVNDLGGKSLPEMIVVGVGTPPEALREVQMRRVYDFSTPNERGFEGFGSKLFDEQTRIMEKRMKSAGMVLSQRRGGAAAFLTFLVEKVRPALARDYRMSDDNTLYGHSGGSLFCTYAFLARPQSFDRYVCTSPNLYAGNYELFRMEERYAETHSDLRAKIFFGAGEGEVLEGGWISAWGIVSSMTRMAEILRLRPYPSLKLYVRIVPGAQHSANSLSLREGLRTLWEADVHGEHP